VYKSTDGNVRLYFIVETKFVDGIDDVRPEERYKIRCGTLHFKAINKSSADNVIFDWANSYDDFRMKAEGELNVND
ncbi:MAG: hypothetical protein FWF81_00405, partial [Defluviitaleaceae bacterium]|nr:hypothetical protein [Defluviitaleaceae bacterium]